MGRTICEAVAAQEDMRLVAAVDPHHVGEPAVPGLPEAEYPRIRGEPSAFVESGAEVVVDFTVADVAREVVPWLVAQGIHAVVGTSGLGEEDRARIGRSLAGANCIIAPNFATGAVLMMRFAELAAPYFDSVEIVEIHHDAKIDAPSGTAVSTAERVAAASGGLLPDRTEKFTVPESRGGTVGSGVRVHAVRLRGALAHQEVLMGTTGQILTIRHDTTDRSAFVPGVLLAIRCVRETPGLTVGLETLMGI